MGITLRKIFFSVLILILFSIPSSKFPLDPIEKITLDHSFSLMNWEIKNIFPKWIYLAKTYIKNDKSDPSQTISLLQKYLSLTKEKNLYQHQLDIENLSQTQRNVVKNNLKATIDEMQMRIEEALNHIEPNRLIAAPDCGLGHLPRNLAKKKLKTMVEAVKKY